MRDIIRSGHTGRSAVKFFALLVVSMPVGLTMGVTIATTVATTVCLGQESSSAQSAADLTGAKQVLPPGSATPQVDTPPPAATPAPIETPKVPDATQAKPSDAVPASSASQSPATDEPNVQSQTNQGQTKGKPNSKIRTTPGSGEPSAIGVQQRPYEIGPEDVLFLNVLHQPDVSSQLSVRPDGFVSVRFVGEIKAAGLTSQQLSDIIADKLTQYFNHPEVNIQVLVIKSKKYYVSGEVRRAGAYTLSTPKTILEAIIEAGGPAEFAKRKAVYVLREHQRIPFNFNDVSKGKHLEQNIELRNGDVIVIP